MKKSFKYYLIIWICIVSLFNLVCFVTPSTIANYDKYADGFWSGYIFIMISFVLHLFFALYVSKQMEKEQKAINVPLTVISIFEITIMIIVGSVCIFIPGVPTWVGIIICYFVLVVSIIILLLFKSVGEHTNDANAELNRKTSNYRELLAKANQIYTVSGNKSFKDKVNKVYEALKYSDSVSNNQTYEIENQIKEKLDVLSTLVREETNSDEVEKIVENLLVQINERNNICRLSK